MTVARTIHIDEAEVAGGLAAVIDRVAETYDRLLILREGKPIAALVCTVDLLHLELVGDLGHGERRGPEPYCGTGHFLQELQESQQAEE
ncbi:hypothetical protein [Tsukamurella pulmonis]|uniref:hypothetical protein n=1 Tax=Tsukamurella pulmonis TaxID=47312 RepID=UPI000E157033|nr:hypothetical protein [Tsukamurella pulmonis]RDH13674.1 hypothetical protein DVB88_01180 [Tsukamurella pulmonis]